MSWQIVPTMLQSLIADSDRAQSERVFAAVMRMKKLVIADLQKAASG
ncbi:MAG: hypothetical protein ABW071_01055 [Casimicrobiaceae bacterium]